MVSSSSTSSSSVASPFRSDCLKGKVALITGGGSGIGFEISRQLLSHGCAAVILTGRRERFLQQASQILQDEIRASSNSSGRTVAAAVVTYQVCDVRKYEECQAVVNYCAQQFGRLDILVNGAAGNFLVQAKDLTSKGFATVMEIDTLGTFNMCRAAYSLLASTSSSSSNEVVRDSAVIINISATLHYGATFWQVHAAAAKSAVDSLTRSLALEWGHDHIRVVGIAPGPIANTPGTTKLAPGLDTNDISDMIAEGIPLGRMGETWEIGHAAVYLCTAKYVTGETVVVDGGQWLYRPPTVPAEMVGQLSRRVGNKVQGHP